MIGQHDAARADANGRGAVTDVGENDGNRAAGDAFGRMMLGDPEALVAGFFCRPRELAGFA